MFVIVFIYLVSMLIAFLIGSLLFAVIVSKVGYGVDVRSLGSGNAGATNVQRSFGNKAAALAMLLDFAKGFLPVFLLPQLLTALFVGRALTLTEIQIAQLGVILFVVLGHAFPLWFSWKGGKGVACAAGGITALVPLLAPFCLLIFAGTIYLSRYVSLASLTTAAGLPLVYLLGSFVKLWSLSGIILGFFVAVSVLIVLLHRANIQRIVAGTESRMRW